MKVIYKYELNEPGRSTLLHIPRGAMFLKAGMQGRTRVTWILQDNDAPKVDVHVILIGTGWDVEDAWEYISTFQDKPYIWHLFDTLGQKVGDDAPESD